VQNLQYLAFLLLLLAACHRPQHFAPIHNSLNNEVSGLSQDSGYILKPQGLALLLRGNFEGIYNDTINLEYYSELKDTDTIGKYYRMDNGNLFACIKDIIHSGSGAGHLMAELAPDKTMITSEYYPNGMYLCCWNNMYDGFRRQGPYYVLDFCGTGSGHCSRGSYFMKGPGDNHGVNITTYIWTSWCTGGKNGLLACRLNSSPEFKRDTIIMHYTLQHLEEKRNDKYKVKSTEKFDIEYVKRDTAWVALDSTRIYEFPL